MFTKCGSKMTWFLMCCVAIACLILFKAVPISSVDTTRYSKQYRPNYRIYDDLPPNLKVQEAYRKRGCNILYHATLHVYICRKLAPVELGQHEGACLFHDWATRMLIVISESNETKKMLGAMWRFFFYTYKVKNNMTYYNRYEEYYSIELEAIHNETFDVLRSRMAMDCPVLETADGKQRIFEEYMNDITKEENTLQSYQDICSKFLQFHYTTSNRYYSASINRLSMHQLHLKYYIAKSDFMNTLITRFGLIPNDVDIKRYFVSKFNTVLVQKTSIKEHISELYEIQRHFIAMLKVMMLRLCFIYLAHIEEIDNVDRRSNYDLNISAKYEEFVQLLALPSYDEVKLFGEQFKPQTNGNNFQVNGMDVERQIYDSSIAKIDYSDSSMETPISTYKSIAEDSGLSTEKNMNAMKSLSLKKSLSLVNSLLEKKKSICEKDFKDECVENSILRVSIFVDYLKQKFNRADFDVIFFFMETNKTEPTQ